jgi:tyrosine-protein kinase Etk/Wzc
MADQPSAHAVDAALADAQTALAAIAAKTSKLPLVQQNLLQLQRDLLIDSERYTDLLNAHRQLTLVRTASVPNVRILEWATAGQFQVESPRGLLIAGAAMSGAILGILLVFLRRTIVAGVEDPLDIEWDTGLPLLATVLRSPLNVDAMQDAPEGAQLELAPAHPRNEASVESLRTLRTTMQYVLADKGSRVVLLTGPTAGVGKSFLSANLAMLSGVSNKRILLLDADLRKGVLHRYFRVARGPGLTDVIMGTHSIETVIHRNVAPGLDLLTAGADVISPSETLLRPELADLIELLSEQYDMVVMDGPPVLLVGDAIALGRTAGTVLLVARHGVSTTREIRESARRLGVADVQICGAVCNDFTPGLGRYGYPYGDEGYFRRLHHEARESAAAS